MFWLVQIIAMFRNWIEIQWKSCRILQDSTCLCFQKLKPDSSGFQGFWDQQCIYPGLPGTAIIFLHLSSWSPKSVCRLHWIHLYGINSVLIFSNSCKFLFQIPLAVIKPDEKAEVPVGIVIGSVLVGLLLLVALVAALWKVSKYSRLLKMNADLLEYINNNLFKYFLIWNNLYFYWNLSML